LKRSTDDVLGVSIATKFGLAVFLGPFLGP
jgi:hypothetical protein